MFLIPRAVIALSFLSLVAGCASARMELPETLATADRLAVEGRGGLRQARDLRFGDYEATAIDRSWTRGSGFRVGSGRIDGGRNRARQTYGFTLSESGRELGRVECEAAGSRESLGVRSVGIDLAAEEDLRCAMEPAANGAAWELSLNGRRDRHMLGQLVTAGPRFRLQGTGPGGGIAPADTRGYEIRADDRVVAAVETVNRGAVWFAPGLDGPDRAALAAAAVALLLYQKVETD